MTGSTSWSLFWLVPGLIRSGRGGIPTPRVSGAGVRLRVERPDGGTKVGPAGAAPHASGSRREWPTSAGGRAAGGRHPRCQTRHQARRGRCSSRVAAAERAASAMASPLEDRLTCSICLGLYRDPVTLHCGHNFCRDCIEDSWRCREKTCPECREPFPAGAAPRRNVALSGLMEALSPAGPRPEPGPEPDARGGARCPRHGRPLELFCRTEGLCVCCACALHECSRHELALLDVERREREGQLRARLERTKRRGSQTETRLQELRQQNDDIQDSARALASVASRRFSSLLRALELRQDTTLKGIEATEKQALARVLEETQRLQGHLEALAQYGHRVEEVLAQVDDGTFFQKLQQLSEPPEPLGPQTPLQWDKDQEMINLKELLSPLSNLLLEEACPPKVAEKAADTDPVETLHSLTLVPDVLCPLRKKLWQNYRNLTFDPHSANRHFYLSCQNQQVTHCCQPQGPGGPGSFELWQVQCAQSFQDGRHYWEVRASDHSVTLGVTYPDLTRRKLGTHTDNIGRGPCSWGLCIQEDNAQAWHDGKARRLCRVAGRLLGVDLDLASGYLSFYSLEPQTQLLHTFHAIFNRPLCPVFWLLEGRTLSLCHQPGAKLPPESPEEASGLS